MRERELAREEYVELARESALCPLRPRRVFFLKGDDGRHFRARREAFRTCRRSIWSWRRTAWFARSSAHRAGPTGAAATGRGGKGGGGGWWRK